jgi:hypothetical protein
VPNDLQSRDVTSITKFFHGGGFVRLSSDKHLNNSFTNEVSALMLETILRGTLKLASGMRKELKQS